MMEKASNYNLPPKDREGVRGNRWFPLLKF